MANAKLEAAKDEVLRLERECREVGHDWQFIGGAICSGEAGLCSFPVHECSKCKDCDYGDAGKIRAQCEAERA